VAHNLLKQNRAVATRFDKLAVRYEATIHVAAINIWLRCLERNYETRPSRGNQPAVVAHHCSHLRVLRRECDP